MINNNYKKIREKNGVSQKELANALNISQQALSSYENGERTPNAKTLTDFADYFNTSIDYILNRNYKQSDSVGIPILGYVAAGIPIDAIEDVLGYEEIDAKTAYTGDFFALKIDGDSMEPVISYGDIVIVKWQQTADSGDIVIAQISDESATCKLLERDQRGIKLFSYNHKYQTMAFNNKEINELPVNILGVVTERRTKFKKY